MVSEELFNSTMILYTSNSTGTGKYNKCQNDCLWKQRSHYRLENVSLGFIENLHKAVKKFATLL